MARKKRKGSRRRLHGAALAAHQRKVARGKRRGKRPSGRRKSTKGKRRLSGAALAAHRRKLGQKGAAKRRVPGVPEWRMRVVRRQFGHRATEATLRRLARMQEARSRSTSERAAAEARAAGFFAGLGGVGRAASALGQR